MRIFLLFSCTLFGWLHGQTISECRQRFDDYLNFHGALTGKLVFTTDAIYLSAQGKRDLTIYKEEIPVLAAFFERSSRDEQQKFLVAKGNTKLKANQIDSLRGLYAERRSPVKKTEGLPLAGFRIAIDPGHFAASLKEAEAEQKYLHFLKTGNDGKTDTVKLLESQLTFDTARLLQLMLEKQGATVMLTRSTAGNTSFNCTFTNWIKLNKKRTLDSLVQAGSLSSAKRATLLKSNDHKFFWDFFRDYDLANRVNKVNAFKPDVTVIIHYNVDEKNVPWKKASPKDFTMAFIGGAFTASDVEKGSNRADFVRLLLTKQLNRSEGLAAKTVSGFTTHLGIKAARPADADYLSKNCIGTKSEGVFCRNLVLCRKINAPLVYGEALYQDNELECLELKKRDLEVEGVKTNKRVAAAARSYFEAVSVFLKNY